MSKGHSTLGLKIPFISNLKKPACGSKRDVLEIATLRYAKMTVISIRSVNLSSNFSCFQTSQKANENFCSSLENRPNKEIEADYYANQ